MSEPTIQQLRDQLAAERENRDGFRRALEQRISEIDQLRDKTRHCQDWREMSDLAAERDAFAVKNPTSFVRIERVQELLATEREKHEKLKFDCANVQQLREQLAAANLEITERDRVVIHYKQKLAAALAKIGDK